MAQPLSLPRALPSFVLAAIATLALSLLTAPSARASEPPFVGWSALLPSLTTEYDPGSEDDCKRGHLNCVDRVIREMERRFEPLASSCDHDAIFALSYLRTTEEYRRAVEDPNYFSDNAFVNHQDAVFAEYYFQPFDDWHKHGRLDRVPPSWRIAFAAAEDREVSAAGNLFLGMNAHINRDLPFVLYGIGLVKPDGSSRKPDHDKVNEFLNRVQGDLIPEIAERFDPTIDDTSLPGPVDDFLTFQAIPSWREAAWRNAERLANAPTDAARDEIAEDIEDYAVAQALTFKALTAYGLLGDSSDRDAYCAAHG